MSIAPSVIFTIGLYIFKTSGLPLQVSVVLNASHGNEAGAFHPQFNLNPRLANLMVGIGIPVSAETLALWWWIVK